VESGNLKTVQRLLRSAREPGTLVNKSDSDGTTALILAAARPPTATTSEIMGLLLDSRAHPEAQNVLGERPLMLAVRSALDRCDGNPHGMWMQSVRLLLERSAMPNVADSLTGETPLMEAACRGGSSLCQLLLDRNSTLWQRSFAGLTAWDFANAEGHEDVLKLLDKAASLRRVKIILQEPGSFVEVVADRATMTIGEVREEARRRLHLRDGMRLVLRDKSGNSGRQLADERPIAGRSEFFAEIINDLAQGPETSKAEVPNRAWTCSECGEENRETREKCNNCRRPRPLEASSDAKACKNNDVTKTPSTDATDSGDSSDEVIDVETPISAEEAEARAAHLRRVEELRQECAKGGLDMKWCTDEAHLKTALVQTKQWQEMSSSDLKKECAAWKIDVDEFLAKPDLLRRLQQVMIWSLMPVEELLMECDRHGMPWLFAPGMAWTSKGAELVTRLANHKFGKPHAVGKDEQNSPAQASQAAQPKAATAPPAEEAKAKTPAMRPRFKEASKTAYKPMFKPAPAATSKAGAKPKVAAKPKQPPKPAARGPTQPKVHAKAKQRSTARDEEEDEDMPDGLDANVQAAWPRLGARVRQFLRQFVFFNGELPGAEAENDWNDDDLYRFFYSNGFIRPKRSRSPRVHPAVLEENYRQLGLSTTAKADEVRRAYRRLALQYHPDKNQGSQDASKFQGITAAYEAICKWLKR